MNAVSLITGNRATLKLLFVGALSLAMLIPLVMVRAIILERQEMQRSAQLTIANRWGGSQTISGLVSITRTSAQVSENRVHEIRNEWQANVLPKLAIAASLSTESRRLGIYQMPVYTASVKIDGLIDWSMLNRLQPEGDLVFWLPLGDVRSLREVSPLKLDGLELPPRPMNLPASDNSGLQFILPAAERIRVGKNYHLELKVAGSQSLLFLPLADTSSMTLDADWPHPEFIGQFLPIDQTIGADGTRASWQLLGLNRPYGDQWELSGMNAQQLNSAGFGMRMETPVDTYQRNERSVKYGFLFIVLTFFTLFLFEVMTGRPLHPVPYLLTGAALAVFYLVLLAFSEYLPFSAAYLIAASLLVLIVTPYTGVVLGGKRRGLLVGAMMSLTYGLLFVLVSAEHLSLLLGAMALLMAIAGLMFLTREVDWYRYGDTSQTDQ